MRACTLAISAWVTTRDPEGANGIGDLQNDIGSGTFKEARAERASFYGRSCEQVVGASVDVTLGKCVKSTRAVRVPRESSNVPDRGLAPVDAVAYGWPQDNRSGLLAFFASRRLWMPRV